jgi:hypothetical protein
VTYRFGGVSDGFASHADSEDDDELAERDVQGMKEKISVRQKSCGRILYTGA